MDNQASKFYDSLVETKAFNMPSEAKKIWSNQYGTGYKFPDLSRFNFYKKAIGVHKNLTDGKTYNHWAFVSYGDESLFWGVKSLKYSID